MPLLSLLPLLAALLSGREELILVQGRGAIAPGARERIESLASQARGPVVVLELGAAGPLPGELFGAETRIALGGDAASDSQVIERTAEAGLLVLRGGGFLRWWAALTPDDRDRPLALALTRAFRRGVPVIAQDGACEFVLGTLIDRTQLNYRVRNPRDVDDEFVHFGGVGWINGLLLLRESQEHAGISLPELLDWSLAERFEGALLLSGDVAWFARDNAAFGPGHALELRSKLDKRGTRHLRSGTLKLLGSGAGPRKLRGPENTPGARGLRSIADLSRWVESGTTDARVSVDDVELSMTALRRPVADTIDAHTIDVQWWSVEATPAGQVPPLDKR